MTMESLPITRLTPSGAVTGADVVALETTFRVTVEGAPAFSFTCTPENVAEMTTGALFSRGYIDAWSQVRSLEVAGTEIAVTLGAGPVEKQPPCPPPEVDRETIFSAVARVFGNPDTLFARTGCAHCCALLSGGEILCAFEDIGRHNALDKAVGYALREGIPMAGCVLLTSGRISGDYMAKLLRGGFSLVVSRAAVTSEAVRLAREKGVTLYGFVRGNTANRYTP